MDDSNSSDNESSSERESDSHISTVSTEPTTLEVPTTQPATCTNCKDKENTKKTETPPNPNEPKTPAEKKSTELRNEIEIKNYTNHLSYIDKELSLKRKRELMKLEEEVTQYEHNKKQKGLQHQIDLLDLQMKLKERQVQWRGWVDRSPEYLRNPIQKLANGDNELILSDRIIELSGPITYVTSEYITERIHYYNNQNERHPIFIVIDYSPGGSVMAGYRILKTIDSSPAPVYVVVKSFAASMAATILTLAPHSYVYPNAIILHHQIWSRTAGNLVQHREQVRDLEEWWNRLASPLIKRLKIKTLDEWIDLMYKANSDGDWSQFGDEAVKSGWADGVVHRIRKTGSIKYPITKPRLNHFCRANDADQTKLPKLLPMDYYWIYNPNGYYLANS